MTVAEVKSAFARSQHLSARKAIELRWYGATLEDGKTLEELKVPNGATFEAAFRNRTQTELEAMRTVRHVLMVETGDVATIIEGVTPTTQIGTLKTLVNKNAPPTARIHFSPAFTSNFGANLADDKTLGACGVLGTLSVPPRTHQLVQHRRSRVRAQYG